MKSITCKYCETDPGAKEGSIVWQGFFDQDTGDQVCNSCRTSHYINKFSIPELTGLYSEMPLIVQ